MKIKPKGEISIKITHFLRDPNEDLSKHKFKFEALALKKDEIQIDIKEMFRLHEANRDSRDKVYSLSRTVKLISGKNKLNNINNIINNNLFNNLNNQPNFNPRNNLNMLYVRIFYYFLTKQGTRFRFKQLNFKCKQ